MVMVAGRRAAGGAPSQGDFRVGRGPERQEDGPNDLLGAFQFYQPQLFLSVVLLPLASELLTWQN